MPIGSEALAPFLAVLVRPTDAKREFFSDHQATMGRLDKTIDEAREHA